MTQEEFDNVPAIDHLRLMAKNFGCCNETFNQRFTFTELFAIHRAWMLAEHDILPSLWEYWQVSQALAGKVPKWDHNEMPLDP